MISGQMDGVKQHHFFLANNKSKDMKVSYNLPTIHLLKESLVHGTVTTTGKNKHHGCFNYVQQFCEAVDVVAPQYFKIQSQPTKKVTLSVTKPRTHSGNSKKGPEAKGKA